MTMVRPSSIGDVLDRLSRFRSPEAMAAVDSFRARPTDVFICTYSKSGTTWMQHVVHQLRSGGSMDFTEISVVVPWIESALDMDIDPAAEQPWSPRAFKSHLSWPQVPRGGRYITVFRDPKTVLPSFYRFFEGWFFEPGSISIEEFGRGLYIAGSKAGRHWQHLIDWWPRVHDDDVLALTYEDMVADPDSVPPVVARFLDIDLDEATMARVREHCRREVMQSHGPKFEEQRLRLYRDPIMGLPAGGTASKVNASTTTALSDALLDELDGVWTATVGESLGLADYEAFRSALPDHLGVRT